MTIRIPKILFRIMMFTGIVLPCHLLSQGEWNQWRFGDHAGLDFNFTPPVSVSGSAMQEDFSTVSVSDSLGNLLFYSDGGYVWDRNNQLMPHGSGLYGWANPNQHVYTVKSLNNDSTFFLFYILVDGIIPFWSPGLYYSVIDMRLSGGLGDVVATLKNIPVPGGQNVGPWMTGTRHRNNKDAWLVVRNVLPDQYLSYRITSSGININPVVSPSLVYTTVPPPSSVYQGQLKISQDGGKLIAHYLHDTIAEYCGFNNENGVVTPLFRFCPKYRNVFYPVSFEEFSKHSRYLYIRAYWPFGVVPTIPQRLLYQYDAAITDSALFMQSGIIIDSVFNSYNGLQLGPDDKIYAPYYWHDSLSVIQNPEIYGTGCNYQKNAIGLNTGTCGFDCPQFLQKYKAYIRHTGSGCQSDSMHFLSDIWPPPDTIRWNFGDPASGLQNLSSVANPKHLFSGPGTYTVELYVRHNDNRTDTSNTTVTINTSPSPNLGPDSTACTGDTITLTVSTCQVCTCLWTELISGQSFGTGQSIVVSQPGLYCIAVSDISGCTGRDTVNIVFAPPVTIGVSIAATVNPACAGTSVTFTATPINGGSSPAYQWQVNSINAINAINATYAYTPANGDQVTVICTSSLITCTLNNPASSIPYLMVVEPILPVSISIVASSNPFCLGNAVTFTATPVNGGTTPQLQWKVNAVNANNGNNAIFTYTPSGGDVVTCLLTSSASCTTGNPALSNSVTMIVNTSLPAGLSIAASANPFCEGTSVTYTATPANGGTFPAYQWKVNANNANNATNAVFTYNPVSGDLVSCIMTSNLNCVTLNPALSNTIIMVAAIRPTVTFTPCNDVITTPGAQPFKLKGGIPLGGFYSGPGVNPVTGIFTPAAAGTGVKTITYTYTNVASCNDFKTITITVLPVPSFTCGNNLTDARDGRHYNTFSLPNGRCWMQQNLDFGFTILDLLPQTDNCTPEKYERPTSFVPRPTFYQWDELMNYETSSGTQGICPAGWHVPTSAEWDELIAFYNGPGQAGGPMKDTLLVNEFHSIQKGFLYQNNTWAFTTGLWAGSMYWTSTTSGNNRAVARGLNEYNPSVSKYVSLRSNAFGVRCVKD